MEQTRYCMWMKRKHSLGSDHQVQTLTNDNSWEEQAFAEDAAGPLGGCIWPPRSYSCSFCRREFKSAQALGGHMNVHRRDRARLKESPSPQNEILHHLHQNHHQCHVPNAYTPLGVQDPSNVCSLVYNPNPNSNPSVVASPLSPSRVSAPSIQENCIEQTLISGSYSSIVQEHHKGSFFSPPPSWSDSVTIRAHSISESKIEGEKNLMIHDSGCWGQEGYVKPDLSVSLNLFVHCNQPTRSSGEEEEISCKRRRIDAPSLSFFLKPSSVDGYGQQSEVLGISPSSMEDLDLELRLGDRPKVK
ncbi:hypothetical protein HHK36_011064 [Tetracentron sinense]|uniref:C2H2-type domain-containing protein n=1 Tax=Tetracentron sinense TaxID=13715 RepID=A0A834ZBB9_TETSI|nr:hypothetical protein HHK36_011064 [Tetracentron sinense]